MSTDLAIVMTLCNRPHYTKRVLDMLAKCDGCSDVPVTLCVEPGNDAVLNLALGFRHPCTVVQNKRKLGCNTNTFSALARGFEQSDRVIALEDDTLPGKDFITFMRWALDKYEDDKSVFSVSGYQRTQQDEITRTLDVVRENWFTPWGWGSWRDRWIECCDEWPALDEQISWDTVIHRMRLGDRCEVRPVVARITRIRRPTLVVWGREDRMFPATYALKLSREIHDARLTLMDAGHAPHVERPHELVDVATEFLAGERG